MFFYIWGSNLLIMKAMKTTIAGKKNRYNINSSTGGIRAPITVEAAMSMIMVITGPSMAINM